MLEGLVKAGFRTTTVNQWENGHRRPLPFLLTRLYELDASEGDRGRRERGASMSNDMERVAESLAPGAALIPENLIKNFGPETMCAWRAVGAFYQALHRHTSREKGNPLVVKLFEQWRVFFGETDEWSARIESKKEFRKFVAGMKLDPKYVVDDIGFDLNPLAVIAARTNYLLALGDLLRHRKDDIDIPVYQCDSILTPSRGSTLFDGNVYPMETSVGEFRVPAIFAARERLDALGNLDQAVEDGVSADAFLARLAKNPAAAPLLGFRTRRSFVVR